MPPQQDAEVLADRLIRQDEPLTQEDVEAVIQSRVGLICQAIETSALLTGERMPEPTPCQRGVLNRYQDRRRKRKR